ncbi:hypothetical protein DNTS_034213 [Danionella cerebrum]|uniref:Platelet-derived growth factor (PDGF) family profile domain-containing protein n=1 Tax=Danionella cerebrum TaxID=2873325 RepID=A0A553MYV0_9TELE|nr:hypothetical protein DNTS_034213 [Danionella translucida]
MGSPLWYRRQVSSSSGHGNTTAKVILFQEVWGRSFCRTIEKLVEVVQEYPGELLKLKPAEQEQEYVEMTFVEHKACECRLRKPSTKQDRWKPRNRGRKRKEKQRAKDCDKCQPPRR